MKSIRPKPFDLKTLRLSPEEGFVLSRVDGATTVKELVALTGLDESRVVAIVGRLATEGALEVEGAGPAPPPLAPPPAKAASSAALEAAREEREEGEEGEEEEGAPEEPDSEAAADEAAQQNELNYRQVYETVYRPLERDARVSAASEASGSDLMALCLDPEPAVITAIVGNPSYTADHARMIALHHRTQIGLEAIAKRTEHLKDSLLQRRLLRNPLLPGTILNRICNPKLMMEVYKTAIDREIPERSRVLTREILRKKFMLSSADEKASLLVKTEGRCLIHLTNCSLDAHATQILCGKTAYSILFIQNLARWSATPPALLSHLLKTPTVRHNVGLRKMLLKHPNMPSEAKRTLR